jgi:hypothetical protein
MGYQKLVRITKGDTEATVIESSLKVYERNGWTRADDGSSDAAPPETVPPAAGKTKEG